MTQNPHYPAVYMINVRTDTHIEPPLTPQVGIKVHRFDILKLLMIETPWAYAQGFMRYDKRSS
ncbi:MAG: hypothetical protein A3F10_05120 [Coxiella sp. RIFCSPHIGHO2_12_FULL_42_15]|nr:MAG: hypothetical protein A3F10_05120 [Coxiella sp. RIFCSPHIGHO2_12_FULL_42_15]